MVSRGRLLVLEVPTKEGSVNSALSRLFLPRNGPRKIVGVERCFEGKLGRQQQPSPSFRND